MEKRALGLLRQSPGSSFQPANKQDSEDTVVGLTVGALDGAGDGGATVGIGDGKIV